MDEVGVNCMIDAFLHFPNVTSMDVCVEVETRKGDVIFENGHWNFPKTSLPINTQLSMAFFAPLSRYQDVNVTPYRIKYYA